MKIKKMKRVCDVKGCRNKDTYAVAKKYGVGMGLIICRECAEQILAAIDELEVNNTKAEDTSATSAEQATSVINKSAIDTDADTDAGAKAEEDAKGKTSAAKKIRKQR